MSDTRAQAKEQLSALIQRVMEDGKIEPGEREELQAVYRQAILTVGDVREVLGRYIKSVQDYNVGIRTFPNNLTAMMFGYKEKPNFTVENEKAISTAPKVDFNPTPAPAK